MKSFILPLIAALAAPLPGSAESGRFSVFGNSPEREAFFEKQADKRADEAAEIAKARARAEEKRLEAEREAALAAARAPAPSLATGALAWPPYHPACIGTQERYAPQTETGSASTLIRERTTCGTRLVGTYRPNGIFVVLGPDGLYYPSHRSGLSINLTFGN